MVPCRRQQLSFPPPPEQARAVFGERFADAVRYAELLADVGVRPRADRSA